MGRTTTPGSYTSLSQLCWHATRSAVVIAAPPQWGPQPATLVSDGIVAAAWRVRSDQPDPDRTPDREQERPAEQLAAPTHLRPQTAS
jgi:hypothetical protein